jgi:hypothetical protein
VGTAATALVVAPHPGHSALKLVTAAAGCVACCCDWDFGSSDHAWRLKDCCRVFWGTNIFLLSECRHQQVCSWTCGLMACHTGLTLPPAVVDQSCGGPFVLVGPAHMQLWCQMSVLHGARDHRSLAIMMFVTGAPVRSRQ